LTTIKNQTEYLDSVSYTVQLFVNVKIAHM